MSPGLDFTTLDCRYPRLYIHGQHETEQVLRDYLRSEYGQGTEWGTELIDVQHGTLVTLQLRLPQTQAAPFVQRINDHGQGRVGWSDAEA